MFGNLTDSNNHTTSAIDPCLSDAGSVSSTTRQASTPSGVGIKPRNRSHDIAAALQDEWLNDDAFLTAVFNGMSITFPAGEKFFIDSVRHYRQDITDPVLQEHIRGFCGQEGFHRREHQIYNETLCAARGYDLEKLEGKLTRRLAWAQKNLSPIQNLAITVAIEHFHGGSLRTFVKFRFSYEIRRTHQCVSYGAGTRQRRWSHKSVAFDVFIAAGGTEKLRTSVMRRATFFIGLELTRALVYILRKDGKLFDLTSLAQGTSGAFRRARRLQRRPCAL